MMKICIFILVLVGFSSISAQDSISPPLVISQEPSGVYNFSETDIAAVFDQIGSDVSQLIQQTVANKLAHHLHIEPDIINNPSRSCELRKQILEKLVDKLNYKLSNNTNYNYKQLTFPQKLQLALENSLKSAQSNLIELIESFENFEFYPQTKEELEKEFLNLLYQLGQGIDEFFHAAENSKCKELLEFKRRVFHLKARLVKLAKKYDQLELEDDCSRQSCRDRESLKKYFVNILEKLIKEIDSFFQNNPEKDNQVLNYFKNEFYILSEKLDNLGNKIQELEEKEKDQMRNLFDLDESEDEENKIRDLEEFYLINLKKIAEEADKFFEQNEHFEDIKGFKVYRKKMTFLQQALLKLYNKIEDCDEEHVVRKLKQSFGKLVKKYLRTIDAFFKLNCRNEELNEAKKGYLKLKCNVVRAAKRIEELEKSCERNKKRMRFSSEEFEEDFHTRKIEKENASEEIQDGQDQDSEEKHSIFSKLKQIFDDFEN